MDVVAVGVAVPGEAGGVGASLTVRLGVGDGSAEVTGTWPGLGDEEGEVTSTEASQPVARKSATQAPVAVLRRSGRCRDMVVLPSSGTRGEARLSTVGPRRPGVLGATRSGPSPRSSGRYGVLRSQPTDEEQHG